jgi:hypothetical protein
MRLGPVVLQVLEVDPKMIYIRMIYITPSVTSKVPPPKKLDV